MPFFSLIIKVTSDAGDVLRPGYDTYVACPIWCRSESSAYDVALRRLNREPKLRAAAAGSRPSEVFHLQLTKTVRIDFSTWLWSCWGVSGITLFHRDGEASFEQTIGA